MKAVLKWIGYEQGAEGLPHIPARDLTKKEVEQHGEKYLLDTGLYIKLPPKKQAKQTAKENE